MAAVAGERVDDAGSPDELRALSRLGFDEVGAATRGIGRVHRAIADRAFRATGPGGRVAHLTHHAIAGGVYAAVRGAGGVVGRAADTALERRADRDERAPSTTSRGSALLGVVNGLIGDRLERDGSELRQPMGVRVDGRVAPAEPSALAAAFPEPGPRLAIFVHGLMETEHAWRLGARDGTEPYGDRSMHVGGANHFALLNHPAVYGRLREWLATEGEALRTS